MLRLVKKRPRQIGRLAEEYQDNEIEELFNTSTDTPITFNKSEVDIKLRNSMFNTPGTVKFELNIKDGTGTMTTGSFYIIVIASLD